MQDIQDLKMSFFLLFIELKCQGKAEGKSYWQLHGTESGVYNGEKCLSLGQCSPTLIF